MGVLLTTLGQRLTGLTRQYSERLDSSFIEYQPLNASPTYGSSPDANESGVLFIHGYYFITCWPSGTSQSIDSEYSPKSFVEGRVVVNGAHV